MLNMKSKLINSNVGNENTFGQEADPDPNQRGGRGSCPPLGSATALDR